MAFVKPSIITSIVMLLGLFSGPALAVDLLEVESSFRYVALAHNSHGPCIDIGWTHGVEDGNSFDLQSSSEDGYCVWSSWDGHCDVNGFRFSGELLPNPEEWPLGWYQELSSQISVLLEVTSQTIISASRAVDGVFSGALHSVTILHPDGVNDLLLGEDNDINSASELLDPGIYRITFSVNTSAGDNPPFTYAGLVEVNWSGSVATEREAWGSLKSKYRLRFME